MARLNLEDHAFSDSRWDVFSALMEWDKAKALGTLAMIWHASQKEQLAEASERQIQLWSLLPNELRLVPALIDSGYISPTNEKTFTIHGNEAQIESLRSRHVKACGAIKKRWDEDRKAKQGAPSIPQECFKHSPSQPQEYSEYTPSISNTNTNTNTKEENRESTSSPPSPKFSHLDLKDIWNREKSPSMKPVSGMSTGGERTIQAKKRCLEEPNPRSLLTSLIISSSMVLIPFPNATNSARSQMVLTQRGTPSEKL